MRQACVEVSGNWCIGRSEALGMFSTNCMSLYKDQHNPCCIKAAA
jgi:hypothetical protein